MDEAGVSVGWPGDCMGRCDRSRAWFSPEGSAVTHGAALLSHGLISRYTQIGAGAQEAICLYEKVRQMFFN